MFDDDDEDPITPDSIAICPSDKPPNADTDKDSDMSDEEAMDNVDHLPAPYVPKWQCGIHNKTRKVTSILLSRTTTKPMRLYALLVQKNESNFKVLSRLS